MSQSVSNPSQQKTFNESWKFCNELYNPKIYECSYALNGSFSTGRDKYLATVTNKNGEIKET